jgi:hypothetical protein
VASNRIAPPTLASARSLALLAGVRSYRRSARRRAARGPANIWTAAAAAETAGSREPGTFPSIDRQWRASAREPRSRSSVPDA